MSAVHGLHAVSHSGFTVNRTCVEGVPSKAKVVITAHVVISRLTFPSVKC